MFGIGSTHIGKVRESNQDYVFVCNESIGDLDNLYIVADGIGGHNSGDVASKKSIEIFIAYIEEAKMGDNDVLDLMIDALNFTNKQIFDMAKKHESLHNMGTTFLAVTIKKGRLYIVHIGDSRIYGIRSDKIVQMTVDHTYAMDLLKAGVISEQEVAGSKESSILTKALGTNDKIEADALFCDVFDGDIFVMCSDGLNTMVCDDDIFQVAQNFELDASQKVDELIFRANSNGGKDNIAVIIIQ